MLLKTNFAWKNTAKHTVRIFFKDSKRYRFSGGSSPSSPFPLGIKTIDRRNIREGMTKVVANPEELKQCPHADQVKYVAFHHVSAKGPIFARSMTRKILGNEEFCMQVDAHTSFAKNWDEMLLDEWYNTENEFGVITSVPPPKNEQDNYVVGGSKGNQVPRQCKIDFRENHFPVSFCYVRVSLTI